MEAGAQPALQPLGAVELLRQVLVLYRRHFWTLLSAALVVMGPLAALNLVGYAATLAQLSSPALFGTPSQPASPSAAMTALLALMSSLCAGLLALGLGVLAPWMGGALTYGSIERMLGRRPGWRLAYRASLPRWPSLWGANFARQVVLALCLLPLMAMLYGLLAAMALGRSAPGDVVSGAAGLLAVCSPVALLGLALALIAGVHWSLSEPVIVGESAGAMKSLSRSSALVAGMRWRMLGRLLILWLAQAVLTVLPSSALSWAAFAWSAEPIPAGGWAPAVFVALSLFVSAASVIYAPFHALYVTANYLDLRVRKERLGEQLRSMAWQQSDGFWQDDASGGL